MMNLYERDYNLLYVFLKVPVLRKEHFSQLGIADTRIKTYVRNGIIEKIYSCCASETYYKLSNEGLKMAKTIHKKEKSFSTKITPHKLVWLADVYFSLDKNTAKTWLIDRELKESLVDENCVFTFPHAVYKKEDTVYGVFIKTGSQTVDYIENLIQTCNRFKINLEIIR